MSNLLEQLAERVVHFRDQIKGAIGRRLTFDERDALLQSETEIAADCDALSIPLPRLPTPPPATTPVSRFQVEYRPNYFPGEPRYVLVIIEPEDWPRMMDGFVLSLRRRAQIATAGPPVLAPVQPATDSGAPTEAAGRATSGQSTPPGESAPGWTKLGDAKQAILTVLSKSTKRMQGKAIAEKAGYTDGTLRHHYGDLQMWDYIDKTKDGYAITPTGTALVPNERV